MVLTETKLADKNNRPWLDKLPTKFKWWSTPQRSGGTIICVKHDITLDSQCSLLASDLGGRYAAIRLHCRDKSLLLIGAYWPSGSSQDALTCRQNIQNLFTSMINVDRAALPS